MSNRKRMYKYNFYTSRQNDFKIIWKFFNKVFLKRNKQKNSNNKKKIYIFIIEQKNNRLH